MGLFKNFNKVGILQMGIFFNITKTMGIWHMGIFCVCPFEFLKKKIMKPNFHCKNTKENPIDSILSQMVIFSQFGEILVMLQVFENNGHSKKKGHIQMGIFIFPFLQMGIFREYTPKKPMLRVCVGGGGEEFRGMGWW